MALLDKIYDLLIAAEQANDFGRTLGNRSD